MHNDLRALISLGGQKCIFLFLLLAVERARLLFGDGLPTLGVRLYAARALEEAAAEEGVLDVLEHVE